MSTGPLTTFVDPIRLSLAIRAYAEPVAGRKPVRPSRVEHPSDWVLVFDTETTTLAGQALRFGTYQLRKADVLAEAGLFYRPEVMPTAEIELLQSYAQQHGLTLRTQAEFVDQIFYGIGYDLRATIVGFNLPFDVSRLAIRYGSARRGMRGGFTFTLSQDKRRPAVRIKHVSRRVSFYKFAAPFQQRTGRSDRKHGRRKPPRPGFFLDVNTLAHALLSQSFSLDKLAEQLNTTTRKAGTEEHGGTLTPEYVAYAVQDTQVTWECYRELIVRYSKLQLGTPVHRIYSEASLGKATLTAMGVRPWREMQPDAPPEILGIIMSTYYGGRSEVRIRREVRQVVLCDFLSMYSTVCTLLGLWRTVIAKGVTCTDETASVRSFVECTDLADLQQQVIWQNLSVLVEIQPEADIVPVRADYEKTGSITIGLNFLTSYQSQWFTLADCLASKLLKGHAPKIVRAIRFSPSAVQDGLKPIHVNGDLAHPVNPRHDDFYKRLIELRQSVKDDMGIAPDAEKSRLSTKQHALKITASATSYGIFAEVNVSNLRDPEVAKVYTGTGVPFEMKTNKLEEPGRFFHPLVATLITGAARLMLALAERLVTDRGLEWSFCDTDSMAIARPSALSEQEFYERVDGIVNWFAALNPYSFEGSILKVEDANKSLVDTAQRAALFCYAVSAKRYVLFNVDEGQQPVLRKASAHGLGHLREPYTDNNPAIGIPRPKVRLAEDLGVALWQHDLWWLTAQAALSDPVVQLPLNHHPAMQAPAVSRYAATTPDIHRWFKRYNEHEGRSYDERVRPFGFLLAFSARHGDTRRPVAPFDRDHDKAALAAFDRITGESIEADDLLSYATALAQYHLSPESKFLNGDFLDSGTTLRRHVVASGHTFIGKEADRWEEQSFLGLDAEATVAYGEAKASRKRNLATLIRFKKSFGERQLADQLGIARNTLRRLLLPGKVGTGSSKLWLEIESKFVGLYVEERHRSETRQRAAEWLQTEIERDGLAATANRLEMDSSNLAKVSSGNRPMSVSIAARLLRRLY